MTAFMKLSLVGLRAAGPWTVEATFDVSGTDETVQDVFKLFDDGRLQLAGGAKDLLNWCEGSAEDVRRVHRAVIAFAEANNPGRFPD